MYGKHQFLKKLVLSAVVGLVALAPLHASAANKLIVRDATGTVDQYVVTDTGYVGIGTNTPLKPIHVVGPNTTTTQILSQTIANSATGGGGFIGYHNRGAVGATALPNAGDRLGYFLFGSFDPIGGRALNAAGVTFRADGAWSSDGGANLSVPSSISFETCDVPIPPATASVKVERIRVSGSGNVGIGTSAPTSKLQVVGLPVFANNAAAITGGLTAGAFYRTGGDPDLVAVVH